MDFFERFFIAILGVVVGQLWGMYICTSDFEKQAIERGYALYSPTKGKFEWKEQK